MGQKREHHHGEYDDGEDKWLDLSKMSYRLLSRGDGDDTDEGSLDKMIGSLINVFWRRYKKFFSGTVSPS